MDKNNNWKLRMELAFNPAHNPAMSEEICDALFEEATNLAYKAFDDVTDDHVECVYFRLVSNHVWGLGHAGAVTVH